MTIDINLSLSIAAGILLASFIKHVLLVGLTALRGNGRYGPNLNSRASFQNAGQKMVQ